MRLSSFGVLLEVINSFQVVSKHCYPRLVELSKISRSSTMPNKVHTSTQTLQASKVESGMLTQILMLSYTNYLL